MERSSFWWNKHININGILIDLMKRRTWEDFDGGGVVG